MGSERPPDSQELARLCTLDSGVEVLPEDVRRYLLVGSAALTRFTADEQHEIVTTLIKELWPRGSERPPSQEERRLLSTDDSEIAVVPDAQRKAWESKGTGYSREDFERDRAARESDRKDSDARPRGGSERPPTRRWETQ